VKEHKLTSSGNFIGAWTPNDVILCDELINYHQTNPNKGPGLQGVGEINLSIKNSVDCGIYDQELLRKYTVDYLQPVLDKYIEKYPYCNYYGAWRVAEYPNVQYYPPGGGYLGWHTERVNHELRSAVRHLAFMTYLNDVNDAGETEFFHQELKIKPKKGLTVIWPTDWTFTHRDVPSMTEEKYIATGWYSFVNAP
jgi:prolyl 4-hydroxylase